MSEKFLLLNCTLRWEEIFGEDTSQYTDTITWQTDMIEMRSYTRFNWGYHYILIVIDVPSKHAWIEQCRIIPRASDEDNRKDNSRRWKMSEKFAYWQRKEIFLRMCRNSWRSTTSTLFYVFCNEGLGRRTIQQYVEEQHVETIYA